MQTRDVFVVGGTRVPFVKSMTSYLKVKNQDLMTASLNALVDKYNLSNKRIGDVALGAVMNSSSNWNLARECVLGTKLHPWTPAFNLQRACGTSLEATAIMALKIAHHQIESGIAAGVDTNSDLPIEVSNQFAEKLMQLNLAKTFSERMSVMLKFRPSDLKPKVPAVVEPRTLLSMGQHCELMVQQWKLTQQEQDEVAYASHQNAAKAYQDGFYTDLVVPFGGLEKDALVRKETSMEKLAKLKPVFDKTGKGTLTAGNSSPLTDGSSAVLLASDDEAKKMGWPKLARFVDAQVSAVDFVHGDGLLMAPTVAVGEMLQRNKMSLQDFDYYEIHEAFAGQVVCTLKAWENAEYCKKYLGRDQALGAINRQRMNVKGGSVALGHPFAATGARIVAGLAKILAQNPTGLKGKSRGLISVCTAGGMGVVAILEAV